MVCGHLGILKPFFKEIDTFTTLMCKNRKGFLFQEAGDPSSCLGSVLAVWSWDRELTLWASAYSFGKQGSLPSISRCLRHPVRLQILAFMSKEKLGFSWTAPNQSIVKEINPEYSLEGLMLKRPPCGRHTPAIGPSSGPAISTCLQVLGSQREPVLKCP